MMSYIMVRFQIMKSRMRLIVLYLIFGMWASFAHPTPIIVVRTATGYLVGTNYTRSDGSQSCKLHYLGRSLLLMAGDEVFASYGVSHEVIFDIEADLWAAFRSEQPA